MARSQEDHEALCRRCGMSCFFAVPVNGLAVVVDELHCRFLGRDDEGRYRCTVYERRFELAPWCQSVESALEGGFLAQDCPYARGVPGYRGKVRLGSGLLRQVLPGIQAEVARSGVPVGADPDKACALLGRDGGRWTYRLSEDGSRYLFSRDGAAPPSPAPGPRRLRVLDDDGS